MDNQRSSILDSEWQMDIINIHLPFNEWKNGQKYPNFPCLYSVAISWLPPTKINVLDINFMETI